MSALLKPPVSLADLASQSAKVRAQARFRSLAIYAKLLGRRWNVTVVFDPRCRTAQTDGKVIKLCPCSIGDEEDAVLMEGLIDHEAGVHCLQTDFDVANARLISEPELVRVLSNVFEDVFGERELKRIKPGCAKTINRALEIMTSRGVFSAPEPDDHPASLLVGGLVYGLRSRLLGQTVMEDFFVQRWKLLADAVGQPLADELWALANQVDQVKNTSQAIDLAKKVYEKIKQSAEQPPPPPADSQASNGSGDAGSPSGSDPSETGDKGDADGGPEDQAPGDDDGGEADDQPGTGGNAEDDDSSAHGDPSPGGASGSESQGDQGADPQPGKTQAQQQAAQETIDATSSQSGTGDLADVLAEALGASEAEAAAARAGIGAGTTWELDRGSPIESLTMDALISELARPVAVRLGSKLDQLLEAEVNVATELKRSGRRMQSQRVVRLVTQADTRVFRSSDEMTAIDTCMMILTDISASMSAKLQGGAVSRIEAASAVTRALGDCLSRFDVPFAVRYFGSRLTRVKEFDNNWRNSRSLYWRDLEGSTCTDQALLGVIPEIASRNEQRKLLVLVTDGVPANSAATVLALQEARRNGVQVTTVLVTADNTLSSLAAELNQAGLPAATVKSPDELAQRVFEAVQSAF